MQESESITFEPVRHTSALEPWEIVLAFLVFAGLLFFAIWRSRRQSTKSSSLKLDGR